MKISLSQGKFALVDSEDYARLAVHRWHMVKHRNRPQARSRLNGKFIFMHRLIFDAIPSGYFVYAQNGDFTDCRKSNLYIDKGGRSLLRPDVRAKIIEYNKKWKTGKKATPEQKKSLSIGWGWNRGRSYRPGKLHHNWKGGVTPINLRIRKSMRYKEWRTKVFVRDNFTCQDCGDRGVTLHAHHIKPFAFFPELRFEVENGLTLCIQCHKKTSTYKRRKLVVE